MVQDYFWSFCCALQLVVTWLTDQSDMYFYYFVVKKCFILKCVLCTANVNVSASFSNNKLIGFFTADWKQVATQMCIYSDKTGKEQLQNKIIHIYMCLKTWQNNSGMKAMTALTGWFVKTTKLINNNFNNNKHASLSYRVLSVIVSHD